MSRWLSRLVTRVSAPRSSKKTGELTESLALELLQRRGLTLVQRNFRTRRGEIDLVMRDGETMVFVEVRYRSSSSYGTAAETVGAHKRARIVAAARAYLAANRSDRACRFDVVTIDGDLSSARVQWYKSAFDVSA